MITIKQAMTLTGLGKRMLARYCQTGQAKAQKIGGQWFIDDDQIPIIESLRGRKAQIDSDEVALVAGLDLGQINERDRLILIRRYVEGKTLQEIADEVGITKGGVSFVIRGYLERAVSLA